jgi:hypothetical protein
VKVSSSSDGRAAAAAAEEEDAVTRAQERKPALSVIIFARQREKNKTHLPELAGTAAAPDLARLARVPRLEVAGALGGSALAVVGGAPVVAVEFYFFREKKEEPARRSVSLDCFSVLPIEGKKKKQLAPASTSLI